MRNDTIEMMSRAVAAMQRLLGAALMVLALVGAAQAGDVDAPQGPVVLTVSGAIASANVDDKLVLDDAGLAGLGTVEIETSTIWTDGVNTFEGVPLKTLLDLLEVSEGTLRASAINDYTVEIPVSDAVEGGPILARKMNGDPMSVREKGPLWVIYPYDSDAAFRTEVIYSRSIWQLDRIEVVR